jgi:hypothetical protein
MPTAVASCPHVHLPEFLLRGQGIVGSATQPQIGKFITAALCEWLHVVDFKMTGFAAALSAFVDVRAPTRIALEHCTPLGGGNVARPRLLAPTALARVVRAFLSCTLQRSRPSP